MPNAHKKQRLTAKIRQTFALLGQLFAETPLEQPGTRFPANRLGGNRREALSAYALALISACEFLPLPGLSSANGLAELPLEQVYFPVTVLDQRAGKISPENDDGFFGGAAALTVASALQRYRQLVLIGAPGSGKTTLLTYLALTAARSWLGSLVSAAGGSLFKERFFLDEAGTWPLLVRLPQLSRQLQAEARDPESTPPELILKTGCVEFLGPETSLAFDFIQTDLAAGQVLLLLDGLDEISDPAARQQVVRWIAALSARYPACRYLVTSRELAATELACLGAGFGLAKISPFDAVAVRQFLSAWNLALTTALAGAETSELSALARQEAQRLSESLEADPRLRELAVTPFNLILLAELARQPSPLPVSRLELYARALERLCPHPEMLTRLKISALWLQEHPKTGLGQADLAQLFAPELLQFDLGQFDGWLCQRGQAAYGLTQPIWQPYLAAVALVEQADPLAVLLPHVSDPAWGEVLAWVAGLWLSAGPFQNPALAAELWAAMAKTASHPAQWAVASLQRVEAAFWPETLLRQLRRSLQKLARVPLKPRNRSTLLQKLATSQALAELGWEPGSDARFWSLPLGEPVWVTIPAGEFWMGAADQMRRVFLAEYQIARVPVTNAQYALYLAASGAQPPEFWRGGQVPRGRERHPVTNVSWFEAQAYCAWLGEKISQPVGLPSEAEWEKAARGNQDARAYPWGETWADFRANTSELGLGETTPVGFFPAGASPFGVLDLAGNVREWTRSFELQPEAATDEAPRVLRGGSYYFSRQTAGCAYRQRYLPDFRFHNFGFRVVISPGLV